MTVSVEILVNNQPVKKYHDSTGKTFIEGRKGSEYTIRVKNNSRDRIKAVMSVDGLNIMTGDNAWDKGYVLDGFQSTDIPGWRINSSEVAKFVFSDLKEAYNESSQQNVGVIGIVAFKEKVKPLPNTTTIIHEYRIPEYRPWYPYPYGHPYSPLGETATPNWNYWTGNVTYNPGNTYGSNQSTTTISNAIPMMQNACAFNANVSGAQGAFAGAEVAASVNEVATGWGDNQSFQTHEVSCEFETSVLEKVLIYYDSAKGLTKRGIDVRVSREAPNAFPGLNDWGCKPPSK